MSVKSSPRWAAWTPFVDAIGVGASQAGRTLGASYFDYLEQCSEDAADFSDAMSGVTVIWSDNISEVIDTTDVRCAVDVGGVTGSLPRLLQRADPALTAVVFDCEYLLDQARREADGFGYADRTAFIAGDFFSFVPRGDLHLLEFILHNWDDQSCVGILRRCREAMRPGGRGSGRPGGRGEVPVRLTRTSPLTALADMAMLLFLSGRERALEMFDALFAVTEVRRTSVRTRRHPQVVMEAGRFDPSQHGSLAVRRPPSFTLPPVRRGQ
jgi:hypothetical protein